jgi:hypothetical protein
VRYKSSIAGGDVGKIFWRGIEIPMIFLQPVARKYAVVLRSTEMQGKHRFYGLALGMLPKILWIEGRQLSLVSEDRKEFWIMAEVKVGLEYYLLPDVSMIEKTFIGML